MLPCCVQTGNNQLIGYTFVQCASLTLLIFTAREFMVGDVCLCREIPETHNSSLPSMGRAYPVYSNGRVSLTNDILVLWTQRSYEAVAIFINEILNHENEDIIRTVYIEPCIHNSSQLMAYIFTALRVKLAQTWFYCTAMKPLESYIQMLSKEHLRRTWI